MEDKILDAINKMTEELDCSMIDRIEIIFDEGLVDVNIESRIAMDSIKVDDLDFDLEGVSLKAMILLLMFSETGEHFREFFREFHDLFSSDRKWADAINMYFNDIAKMGKHNYKFQVIEL